MKNPVVAVTWEKHRRMQGLCARLRLPLFELTHSGGRAARYLWLTWRTIRLVLAERPRVLLVQNPSIVLTLLALVLRPFGRYRLLVDAHNEAVQPFIHSQWPVPGLARWLLRRADLTIVTNSKLADEVERAGGRAFVLPDSLPEAPFEETVLQPTEQALNIMVVSTYAPDEPIADILAVADRQRDKFRFHITGNDRKLAPELRAGLAPNVRLTGFVPEHDYWLLMRDSHVVLDLTLMPDCLVCGAYEALAACRPMILSNNDASRELFGEVAVLAEQGTEGIERALLTARANYANLADKMAESRTQFEHAWRARADNLVKWLQET
ncbi:MAG: glycosyltransferase [Burkholderiaceae bacterium]|nr:glycosyltransferase [Burkholderiaceae bacterium]